MAAIKTQAEVTVEVTMVSSISHLKRYIDKAKLKEDREVGVGMKEV